MSAVSKTHLSIAQPAQPLSKLLCSDAHKTAKSGQFLFKFASSHVANRYLSKFLASSGVRALLVCETNNAWLAYRQTTIK